MVNLEKRSEHKHKRNLLPVKQWALGGVIGMGLFVGSSVVIQSAGPAAILSFLITGTFINPARRDKNGES
jgi:L-asparagine transporter-like permease